MTKAERTREKVFKSAWLPAATGQPAADFAQAHITYLKDLYPFIWYLGPRGELVERQYKVMQRHFDVMLHAKHKQQEKLLGEFTQLAFDLDNYEFDHRDELDKVDNRVINTFMYPREITEDLPNFSGFYLKVVPQVLQRGNLPYVDHALNQVIEQIASLTVNKKRLEKSELLHPVAAMFHAFCVKWELPED